MKMNRHVSRWKASTAAEEIDEIFDVMFWFDRELKQVEKMIVDVEKIKSHLVGRCKPPRKRVVDIGFA